MTGTPQILRWDEKHTVKYVIPLWQRDAQIASAIARKLPGIQATSVPRDEPVAIACYGPSLRDTWEQLRRFRHIISCSGAHRFLIDCGIVPTWHVAVDPLPGNTVRLIGQPHQDVEYLIASTCHPDVFDHLAGYSVRLWHVFDSGDEGIRALPAGEWALSGGADVGMRCFTIARFFGFTDLHVFGMDGSYGEGRRHADEHPVPLLKGAAETDYDGATYRTTVAMLECAKMVWHELDQMPGVRATFYGEGLVQHMARNYKPNPIPKEKAAIGLVKPSLISAEYAELNARLHRDNIAYGVGGEKHAKTVLDLCAALKTKDVLDYGCGKGRLAKSLPFHIQEYDPAIPGKEESPKPADVVICSDVLEHIEPDRLGYVLSDLRRVTLVAGYFVIHTGPAQKTLADGRNTHLIQQGLRWWEKRLAKFFTVAKVIAKGQEIHVVVGPKPKAKAA